LDVLLALKPWLPRVTPELVTNALYHAGLWDELAKAEDRWATYKQAYEQVKDENERLRADLRLAKEAE